MKETHPLDKLCLSYWSIDQLIVIYNFQLVDLLFINNRMCNVMATCIAQFGVNSVFNILRNMYLLKRASINFSSGCHVTKNLNISTSAKHLSKNFFPSFVEMGLKVFEQSFIKNIAFKVQGKVIKYLLNIMKSF